MRPPPASPVILHIPTSPGCNNLCAFCIDGGGGGRRFSLAEHTEQLAAARAFTDEVVFTGGEPTLVPHLAQAVEAARRLGFRHIGLVTNGRRLRDAALCRTLLDAGLTQLTVSLHGPEPALHDAITGRPGSWADTRAGLAHLVALRAGRAFALRINCTLVRANLGALRAMADLASEVGADGLNFNAVEPRGRALEGLAEVVPRYAEVVDAADASGLDFDRPELSLSRVPPCAGGCEWVQEDYHFTTGGRVTHYDPAEGKVRVPQCAGCAVAAHCPGLWETYVAHHGADDLLAVADPRSRAGEVAPVETGAPALDGKADRPTMPWSRQAREAWLRGYRRVLLRGGEPLLHPDFPGMVRLCRRIGFSEVAVQTSARPLARPAVAAAFARLGLDRVVVELPGGDRAACEASTGVPGSFRQAVRGMAALAASGIAWELRYTGPPQGERTARALALRLGVPLSTPSG